MPPDGQRDPIAKEVGQVKEICVRTEAKLDAFVDRTRDEVDALFKIRSDHEKRLSDIERSYVPKGDCGKRVDSIEQRLTAAETNTTNVRIKLAMIFGGAVVGSSLANWLITAALNSFHVK
jgi:hypothetical protein